MAVKTYKTLEDIQLEINSSNWQNLESLALPSAIAAKFLPNQPSSVTLALNWLFAQIHSYTILPELIEEKYLYERLALAAQNYLLAETSDRHHQNLLLAVLKKAQAILTEDSVEAFVYGTLMAEQRNHELIKDGEFLGTDALENSQLFNLLTYPMLVPGDGIVYGEVYRISLSAVQVLDRLEDHPHYYCRRWTRLQSGRRAIVYAGTSDKVKGYQLIPDGKWLSIAQAQINLASNSVTADTYNFLLYLRSLDIQLFAAGDKLRCNAPKGVLTLTLTAEIARHKTEIIKFLQAAGASFNSASASLPLFFADRIQLESESGFVAPSRDLEVQLIKIWENIFHIRPIGIRDNFFALGGNSLLAVRLVAQIEKAFNKKLPLATLFEKPTIESLAGILSQADWSPSWSSLVPLQTQGYQTPLFLIHAVGGNLLEYERLIHNLGQERPIYGLQAIGLDGKQEPLASIEAMASLYIEEIRRVRPSGPYLLLGYSFGGIVAFEIAQQLQAQGERIDGLLICDQDVPCTVSNITENKSWLKFCQIHINNLIKIPSFVEKLEYIWERICYKLTNLDYRKYLVGEIAKIKTSSPDFLLKLVDTNLQASANYQPKIYPGSLILWRCKLQDVKHYFNRDLGWGQLAAGGVEVRDLPGTHETLLKDPDVQVLAKEIKAFLAK